ncbi:unnamed protein product, partial [Nesidiocoris tenuis]
MDNATTIRNIFGLRIHIISTELQMMTMNVGMYQYEPYAYDEHYQYSEQEYHGHNARTGYYSDPGYQEYASDPKSEYCPGSQDVTHINGLSYTNLDYSFQKPEQYGESRSQPDYYEYGNGPELVGYHHGHVKEESHLHHQSYEHQNQQTNSGSQTSQQSNIVPTYKWMQVKRNVPKPN